MGHPSKDWLNKRARQKSFGTWRSLPATAGKMKGASDAARGVRKKVSAALTKMRLYGAKHKLNRTIKRGFCNVHVLYVRTYIRVNVV